MPSNPNTITYTPFPGSDLWRGFEAHIEERFYENEIGIYLVRHDDAHAHSDIIAPATLTIRRIESQMLASERQEPTLALPRTMVLAIMTALWRRGLRPVGVTDDSARVDLLKEHTADLREELKRAHTVIRELNSIIARMDHP